MWNWERNQGQDYLRIWASGKISYGKMVQSVLFHKSLLFQSEKPNIFYFLTNLLHLCTYSSAHGQVYFDFPCGTVVRIKLTQITFVAIITSLTALFKSDRSHNMYNVSNCDVWRFLRDKQKRNPPEGVFVSVAHASVLIAWARLYIILSK